MKVECEGGAAAWLAGTQVAPSVQGHKFPPPQELWPYQSFVYPLVAGYQKASLASLSLYLHLFRHLEGYLAWSPSLLFSMSGTWRGPPTGVLLCRSAHQALKVAPWVGSCSVVQCIRCLIGQPLYCSAANVGMWRKRGYGGGSTPYV